MVGVGAQADEAEHRPRLCRGEATGALARGSRDIALLPALHLLRGNEGDGKVRVARLPRLQPHAQPQRRAGVERTAQRAGKRARRVSFAALEAGAIRLPGHFPARRQRDKRIGRAPRPARSAREHKRALRRARGGCEKALEGGMRPAIIARTERHGEGERHLQFPRRRRAVMQAQREEKRAVLRRKRGGERNVHAVDGALVMRAAGIEAGAAVEEVGLLPCARRVCRETDSAARIEQVAKAAVGQDAFAGKQRAAAGREQRRRPRAKEQMRVHEAVLCAPCAGDAVFGAPRALGRKRLAPPAQFHAGGGLFLQQKGEGAGLGDVLKAARNSVVRQRVGQRRQRHALMVRHVALDQLRPLAGARAGVVGGLIKAVFPRPSRFAHGQRVVRCLCGADRQRQQRGVGRDYALPRAAAQRHFAQAKGAVLVVQAHIEGIVAGFAHAPRALPRRAQATLQARDGVGAFVEQRAGARTHKELRHQVFEHGAAPGDERLFPAKAHTGAGEAAEVLDLHLAQHHRHIAEDARFRGQQIVVRRAQAIVLHIRADPEQLAFPVEKAGEVHAFGQGAQTAGERRVERAHPGGAGQKRGGEVSAVHRGDVARAQRAQRVDVVPVVEMAMPRFHALERLHRGGEALAQFGIADETEGARREAGGQVEADVGGRCAAGRAHGGIDLHIVRRQKILPRRDVRLEEAPCLARQPRERAELPRVQGAAAVGGRILQVAQQPRGEQKQGDERQRGQQPRGGKQPRYAEDGSHAAGRAHARAAGGGVGGGHPVEHVFFGEGEAEERARGRVKERRRRRGQRRQLRHRPPPEVALGVEQMRQGVEEGIEHAQGKGGAQVEPDALQKQRQQRRKRQRAQEVIQQLQPRERGQAAAKEEGQKLPVPARPAVEAFEIGGERFREAVVKGDVVCKGRAGQFALDEVVAEDAAFGQFPLHGLHEGAHIVDALAAKAAAAGHVLIEVRDGDGIGVHAARTSEEADEAVFDRRGGELHIRLHDGIAAARAAFCARAVEGVQERAGEGVERAGKGAGVGVERRHQRKAPGEAVAGFALGGEGVARARRVQEQAIERHQRPALALVSHPALVRGIETALAVQVKVLFPAGALVHGADAGAGGGEYLRVVRLRGGGAVAEVAEKEVGGVFVAVEAAERFQIVAEFEGALCGAEQRRHHHQQTRFPAQRFGAELQQPARARKARGKAAQQQHGRAPRKRHAQRQHQEAAGDERVGGKQRREAKRLRGDEPAAARVGDQARRAGAGTEAGGQRRAALVFIEPPADRAARAAVLSGRRRRLPGHHLFAEAQAAAEGLHLLAHGGAGGVVHARIRAVRVGAQFRLGAGELRETLLPVEGVEHALAADEIVQAHGQERLRLVLQADHLFAALAQARHPALQAGAHLGQLPLHGELQGALEKGRRIAHAPRAVIRFHEALGRAALTGMLDDGARAVTERFGKGAAQRGGHGPDFGHGQRLHVVKGAQGQKQALAAEGRVAQGHDLAHEHEHARRPAHGGQTHAAIQTRLRGAGLHDARVLMQALKRRRSAGAFPQDVSRLARERLRLRRQRRGAGKARAAVHMQLHRQRAHVAGERAFVPLPARAELALRTPRAEFAGKPCQTVHIGAFLLKYHR